MNDNPLPQQILLTAGGIIGEVTHRSFPIPNMSIVLAIWVLPVNFTGFQFFHLYREGQKEETSERKLEYSTYIFHHGCPVNFRRTLPEAWFITVSWKDISLRGMKIKKSPRNSRQRFLLIRNPYFLRLAEYRAKPGMTKVLSPRA